jgi:hypothetical protein
MAPSAYMTNMMAPYIAKGIRQMEVIRDHPDWWVVCSLDGFASHLVAPALQVFRYHNIFLVKEEGDMSQVDQAYDQSVAKAGKACICNILDLVRRFIKSSMTQWQLIAVCCEALQKVTSATWVSSFKKVNMHPYYRVEIGERLKHIDDKVEVRERFFKNHIGLFDAMPAVWKHMPCEICHEALSTIKGFFGRAAPDESIWTKENLCHLLKFRNWIKF